MGRNAPHGEDRVLGHLKRLMPASPEPDYERLAAYAFAGRFVEGKKVADVCWDGVGRGSRLLAGLAAHVVGLTRSPEAADLASSVYPAPNIGYETVELPTLQHPEDSFDVVVALGVVENLPEPGGLLAEIRRVLRPEGALVVSVPDKAHEVQHRGGMFAPEAEELLRRQFGGVQLYGLGAVAGGFVGPYSGENTSAGLQWVRSSDAEPELKAGRPATRSILAVCGAGAPPVEDPLLLLDRDGRVFDEHEELARDVGLMWGEVDRMQETEAQSFQDTLKLFRSEISYLRARVRGSEAKIRQLEGQAAYAQRRIRDMENSATWRLFEPYRQLRSRIDAARGPGDGKETDDSSRT
jgi:SAM-dependent methyltransferase